MNRTRLVLTALTTAAAMSVPVAFAPPADASPVIRITKIHYGQSGTNLNTEYIVFKNTTSTTKSIGGWKIISAPSTDKQYYVFPTTTIGAGQTLTLYTGKGTNTATKRYWNSTTPKWDNDGDLAILKNKAGTKIDSCKYAGGGTTAYC